MDEPKWIPWPADNVLRGPFGQDGVIEYEIQSGDYGEMPVRYRVFQSQVDYQRHRTPRGEFP